MSHKLLALPVALALMTASPALAVETGTSGYNQTPPKPSSGTGPAKETATPKTSTTPTSTTAPTSTTPTSTPAHHASTLPFTGLDLRWVVGLGVALLGAGLSLRLVQRRQREPR
jgi:cell division septation protein DedD